MGTARSSSARLLNVAGVFASGGARAVEQYLSIENLSNKSASDAFIAITDFICPDGGPQDEGIAKVKNMDGIEQELNRIVSKISDVVGQNMCDIVHENSIEVFSRIEV